MPGTAAVSSGTANKRLRASAAASAAMNLLAHFWLAERKHLPLVGALFGEWVRGRLDDRFDAGLRQSIHYHRLIDGTTDRHAGVVGLREDFPDGERRYAGIVLDVVFDHALALDWPRYSPGLSLSAFAQGCDDALVAAHADFIALGRPPAEAGALRAVLESYRTTAGIDRALARIGSRLSSADRFRRAAETWRRHLPAAAALLPQLLADLQAIELGGEPAPP
jgi:acyl carrier protein phosphodiesterase